MKYSLKSRRDRWESIAALVLVIVSVSLLFAGCGSAVPAPNDKPSPAPTLESTANPTAPAEEYESPHEAKTDRLVYIPSYEPFPVTMDPLTTRFPKETEDGVWFIRMVQTPEESGCCLMKGGKDATDPIVVVTFPADNYIEKLILTPQGTVWVNKTVFTTGEVSLVEIDNTTGETIREIPFPSENGTITGLFDLPDGSIGIVTSLPTAVQSLFSLDNEGNISPLEAPLNESGNFLLNVTFCGSAGSGLSDGECLAYDKDTLFSFTPGSKERRDLFNWSDWGISSFNTTPISMKDGTLRLLDVRYQEYITLRKIPESEVTPRQEITMACLNVQTSVEDAVREFNRRSTDYYVTIKDYSDGLPFTIDVKNQAITAMNLDIISGKMPDLLSVQDGVPFKSYAEKDLLLDLTPLLEAEGIQLLPQLQRAGTVGDKVLMVSGSFAILTAAGNYDYLGDISGWTIAEAMGLANSLPNCTGVFTSFMTRDRYLSWFYSYLEGFLDWETGTAHFEDLDFQNMLTFANTLPTERPLENTTDAEIIEGRALINPTTITSINGWQFQDLVYMGKLAIPGFPTRDRISSLIYMTMPMSISVNTSHPDGAWTFIKSLLDSKVQSTYTSLFPSVQEAFDNQLAEAMREPTADEGYKAIYVLANGGQYNDPSVHIWTEEEPRPRFIYYWMDENGSIIREEKMYAMNDTQRDRLLSLLDSAQRSTSYDQVIASIVREEAEAFFAGQRTVEEVSQRIQSRVELYMAEQS